MHEEIFLKKPFVIKYDRYDLEVSVQQLSREHFVKCMFQGISTHRDAFNAIYRFFNEVEWFHAVKPRNAVGGHVEGVQAHLYYNVNCDGYLLGFEQRIFDKIQHQALGFYREAKCNESPFYRFMCYRKILETPFAKKDLTKQLVPWIEDRINSLESDLAKNFRDRKIEVLKGKSVADWLHENCRHPLSHATKDFQVIDASDYNDREDIKWANTVMEELACKAITGLLNVPTRVR